MIRRIASVAVLCLAVSVLTISSATAVAPRWRGPVSLPVGSEPAVTAQAVPDPAGGALLYYSRNGVPTLSRVSASGELGPARSIPAVHALGNAGQPDQVAFLNNGGAVITWVLRNLGTYMAYRSPSGKFGKPVALPSGTGSVAVRTGEVLTELAGGTGVQVESWKLTPSGVITHRSGPTNVYTGGDSFGQAWLALDPRGTAELVVDNSDVVVVGRTAKGKWGAQKQLSTVGADVSKVVFATSPGGRAIVGWVEVTGTNAKAVMYVAVRDPGHTFGARAVAGSGSNPTLGVTISPAVAAGADGTLAIGVNKFTGTTPAYDVRIVPPKSTAMRGAVAVAGNTAFTNSSLGAGDSKAIAGLDVEKITADSKYAGSYHAVQTVSAAIISLNGRTVTKRLGSSTGLYDGNGGVGCPCAQSPPLASVTGVAVNGPTFAVAVGQLTPAKSLRYAVRHG